MILRKHCSEYCAHSFQMKNTPPEKHPGWRGGKSIHASGYIMVRLKKDEYPSKKGRYVMEHRFLIEKHLGRKLSKNEDVHHKNGIRTDNRIENLIVLTKKEHQNHHHRENLPTPCLNCNKMILKPKKITKFCSKLCFKIKKGHSLN